MRSCVFSSGEYVILKKSNGYIVVNTAGTYNNHSHFDYSLTAAKNCIQFVQKKIIPKKSKYMAVACMRISIDPEYIDAIKKSLENKKDTYVNYSNLMKSDCHVYRRHNGAYRQVK